MYLVMKVIFLKNGLQFFVKSLMVETLFFQLEM